MNLTLTPDIETPLVKKAEHLGTTPELLALDLLRLHLLNESQTVSHEPAANLAEMLRPHVGVLSSKSLVPGGAQLSEQTGRKFAEALLAENQKAKP